MLFLDASIGRGITLKPVIRCQLVMRKTLTTMSRYTVITVTYKTFSPPFITGEKSQLIVFHVRSVREFVLLSDKLAAQFFFYSHISEIVKSSAPRDGSAERGFN